MPNTENGTINANESNVKYNLRFTELRNNPLYVRYYGLIGSGFVMVILPMFILISTFITLMRYIPKGSTKHKTMRIMAIIIIMFVTCHLPKVSWTIQVVPLKNGNHYSSLHIVSLKNCSNFLAISHWLRAVFQ